MSSKRYLIDIDYLEGEVSKPENAILLDGNSFQFVYESAEFEIYNEYLALLYFKGSIKGYNLSNEIEEEFDPLTFRKIFQRHFKMWHDRFTYDWILSAFSSSDVERKRFAYKHLQDVLKETEYINDIIPSELSEFYTKKLARAAGLFYSVTQFLNYPGIDFRLIEKSLTTEDRIKSSHDDATLLQNALIAYYLQEVGSIENFNLSKIGITQAILDYAQSHVNGNPNSFKAKFYKISKRAERLKPNMKRNIGVAIEHLKDQKARELAQSEYDSIIDNR